MQSLLARDLLKELQITLNTVHPAIDLYWRSKSKDGLGDLHFFRTTVLERLKTHDEGSQAFDRILKKKNNLPFMNQ